MGTLARSAGAAALLFATTAWAQSPPVPAAEQAQGEPMNALGLKGTGAVQFLHHQAATPDHTAPEVDYLGGFLLSYERTLIPSRLSIEFSKPFLFTKDRFDAPFDFLVKGLYRIGDFEPFVAGGATVNLRVFSGE